MTCKVEELRSFLLSTAYSMADFRDEVTVHAEEDGEALFLWLSVSSDDYVHFIGGDDDLVRSLQVVVGAIGAKKGIACIMGVIQPRPVLTC